MSGFEFSRFLCFGYRRAHSRVIFFSFNRRGDDLRSPTTTKVVLFFCFVLFSGAGWNFKYARARDHSKSHTQGAGRRRPAGVIIIRAFLMAFNVPRRSADDGGFICNRKKRRKNSSRVPPTTTEPLVRFVVASVNSQECERLSAAVGTHCSRVNKSTSQHQIIEKAKRAERTEREKFRS